MTTKIMCRVGHGRGDLMAECRQLGWGVEGVATVAWEVHRPVLACNSYCVGFMCVPLAPPPVWALADPGFPGLGCACCEEDDDDDEDFGDDDDEEVDDEDDEDYSAGPKPRAGVKKRPQRPTRQVSRAILGPLTSRNLASVLPVPMCASTPPRRPHTKMTRRRRRRKRMTTMMAMMMMSTGGPGLGGARLQPGHARSGKRPSGPTPGSRWLGFRVLSLLLLLIGYGK